MYYIYILRCAGGTLYTGVTTDLRRRFSEHCSSRRGAKNTHAHRPDCIEAAWSAPDRPEAQRLEARIKALPRAAKLRLIAGAAPEALLPDGCVRIPLPCLDEPAAPDAPEQNEACSPG